MKKITLLIVLLSSIFMNAQRFDWVATAGYAGTANGYNGAVAIARDSQGNVYTLDTANAAQQSQGVTATPASGGTYIFLYKFNVSGEIVYIKPIGTNFIPLNVVVGENDNVYVLGSLMGTSDIRINGVNIIDTDNRNYIFKLDSDGNLIWRVKNNISFGNFTSASMLLFANNHIYFQSGPLSITKVNTSGQFIATLTADNFTSATATNAIFFRGACVLANGDLIFSATSMGTITYGTTVLVPTENSFLHTAMLTLRTTENLSLIWANYTNGLRNPDKNTIPMTIGNDNGIYFGLQVSATLTAGSDTVTNSSTDGSTIGAILKMDADGNKIWLKSTTSNVQSWSLLNNPDGTGVFCGGQIFGFQPVTLGTTSVNPVNGNSVITKIDYSGVFQNSFAFSSGPIGSHVRSLTTDNTGGFYVGGKLNNSTSPIFSCVSRDGNNGLYAAKFTEEPDTAPSPSINVSGNTLTATPPFSGTIQWFLDGQLIVGATSQTYPASANGDYSVSYSYVSACAKESSKVSVTITPNLILNPGNELPTVNGEIPHWTETLGDSWIQQNEVGYMNGAPLAGGGSSLFFPAASVEQNSNFQLASELAQTIDITNDITEIDSGNKTYYFNGYTRSYAQFSTDQANIFIEFLDENNVVLNTFSFGPYITTDAWNNVSAVLLAPINSRQIKIKLHSIRVNGTNNDACYDNLFLGSIPLLGVSENEIAKSNIIIFPNPSTGIFNINSNQNLENASIKVFDLNGRMVHQSKGDNLESKSLDLKNLQSGIYILKIENEEYKYSQKIIKM